MRRKQLFALAMASALALGMTPYAAYAEENGDTLTLEAPAEIGETEEVPSQEPVSDTPSAETAPEETPAETPTETPAETPSAEELPQTEEAAQTGEVPTETPAPAIGEGTVVATEAELIAAVLAAPDSVTEEDSTTIIIGADIDLTQTVVIPANKRIVFVGINEGSVIGRAAGFTGDMFRVEGGILSFQAGTTAGTTDNGTIVVSGMQDGTTVDGSIIHVVSGTFGMDSSVALKDNVTSGQGGAVKIETGGRAVFVGGSIYDNQAADGGAVYSEGILEVEGNIDVSGNTNAEGGVNNIALAGSAFLGVRDSFGDEASVGIHAVMPTAGMKVIQVAEGATVDAENILNSVFYDDENFEIDAEGNLAEKAFTPELSLVEGPSWNSRTSVTLTCVSDSDGWYYAGYGITGGEVPEFDVNAEGTPITANENFTITLDDLDSENPITIYVLVRDTKDNLSAKKSVNLDESSRPTPAPTATATPTPTAAPTPTETPLPTATPNPDDPGLVDPTVTPEPTHIPVIPDVNASVVHGLENALELWPNTFYSFSVTGAGSDNTNPGEGDVQWVPQYWVQLKSTGEEGSKQTTWKIGAKSGIYEAKTLPIRIYLKKYVYQNGQWVGTEDYQYISYTIQTAALSASVTPGATTGDTSTDPTALAADGTSTAQTGEGVAATNAKTGDNSPVGSMMMLAAISILAGGYVIVRRRKKEI